MSDLTFESSAQLNAQGRVTIPRAVREALNIDAGSLVTFVVDGKEVKMIPSKIVHRDEEEVTPATPSHQLATINLRTCLIFNFPGKHESFLLIPELDQDGEVVLYLFEHTQYWLEALERSGRDFAGDYSSIYTISVTPTTEGVDFTAFQTGKTVDPIDLEVYTSGGRLVADVIADILNSNNSDEVDEFIDSFEELG